MFTYIYTDIYTSSHFSSTRREQQSVRWHAFMEQCSTHSGGGVPEIQMVVQFTAWIKR